MAGRKNKDGRTPQGKGARQRVQGWRQGRSRRKGRVNRSWEQPKKASSLSEWLDQLEQNSWNLELIVSGITLLLLYEGRGYLDELLWQLSVTMQQGDSFLPFILLLTVGWIQIGYYVLLGMFTVHLTLRGFWIGAIGLRSVSGGLDLKALRLDDRYGKWLGERLGSFDDYIVRLEQLSSATYSLAYLLFFAILSIGLFCCVTFGISSIFAALIQTETSGIKMVLVFFLVFSFFCVIVGGIVYLIDFVTFGWVKQSRRFGKLYWPIYRFFGWVTLARLYRPLYYNVIDNQYSRRLIGWYLVITILILVVTSNDIKPYFFFPDTPRTDLSQNYNNYLDELEPRELQGGEVTIASKYAGEDYLEIFVPYPHRTAIAIKGLYPDVTPDHEFTFTIGDMLFGEDEKMSQDSLLDILSSTLRLSIDDEVQKDVPWLFYNHPQRKQPGLVYQLPVYDLPRGRHRILVEQVSTFGRRWRNLPHDSSVVDSSTISEVSAMDTTSTIFFPATQHVNWAQMDAIYFWR